MDCITPTHRRNLVIVRRFDERVAGGMDVCLTREPTLRGGKR
jgi:hypothetical protein